MTVEQFLTKVNKTDNCWFWTGSKDRYGYGQLRYNNRLTGAHRVSYTLHKGEIGDLFVLHHCDTPPCVNPAHLFLGTNLDNTRDRMAKHRRTGPVPASECKRGHELMGGNLMIRSNGKRRCRKCHNLLALRSFHKTNKRSGTPQSEED